MEQQLSFLSSTDRSHKKSKPTDAPAKKKESGTFSLYVDGASRGNPGPSGAGICIMHNKEVIYENGFFLGKKTNNQAEYLALALGLFALEKTAQKNQYTISTLHVISDSQLLIQQMKGIYKIKDEKLKLLKQCIDAQRNDYHCTFTHVLRAHNSKADEMANKGIDTKNPIPASFLKLLEKCEQ